jgi:hypothetical protein
MICNMYSFQKSLLNDHLSEGDPTQIYDLVEIIGSGNISTLDFEICQGVTVLYTLVEREKRSAFMPSNFYTSKWVKEKE